VAGLWTLNGTFIGFQNISSQLQLCPVSPPSTAYNWLATGHQYSNQCQLNLLTVLGGHGVWDANGVIFFDLCKLGEKKENYIDVYIKHFHKSNNETSFA